MISIKIPIQRGMMTIENEKKMQQAPPPVSYRV